MWPKKFYVRKQRGKKNYQMKGNGIKDDFPKFQRLHKSSYYFNISPCTHTLTGAQRNGQQVRITVQVQCDSRTNATRHARGEFRGRAANTEGSRAKEDIHHVLAGFLLSDLLPAKASYPMPPGAGYFGQMCTDCKNTSVQAHPTVPRPRLLPATLSALALCTNHTNQQQDCPFPNSLADQQRQLTESRVSDGGIQRANAI